MIEVHVLYKKCEIQIFTNYYLLWSCLSRSASIINGFFSSSFSILEMISIKYKNKKIGLLVCDVYVRRTYLSYRNAALNSNKLNRWRERYRGGGIGVGAVREVGIRDGDWRA